MTLVAVPLHDITRPLILHPSVSPQAVVLHPEQSAGVSEKAEGKSFSSDTCSQSARLKALTHTRAHTSVNARGAASVPPS